MTQRPRKQGIFHGRRLLIVNAVILFIVAVAFVRVSVRNANLRQQTIAQMEERIEDLQKKTLEFAELNDQLDSELFLEEEARLRFGLVKPGERVVVLDDTPASERTIGGEALLEEEEERYTTSLSRWWLYFSNPSEFERLRIRERVL